MQSILANTKQQFSSSFLTNSPEEIQEAWKNQTDATKKNICFRLNNPSPIKKRPEVEHADPDASTTRVLPKVTAETNPLKKFKITCNKEVVTKDITLAHFQPSDKRNTIEYFLRKDSVKLQFFQLMFPRGYS